MDSKIEILLNKVNIDKDHYQYFSSAKITRIVVNKQGTNWNIFIDINELLPLEVFEELEEKKYELDPNAKDIKIIYNVENKSIETYLNYYPALLRNLKEKLKVLEIYEDCLKIENEKLILVTSTDVEKERLESCSEEIKTFYKQIGYEEEISIELRHEENILEEIKQELETTVTAPPHPETKEVKPEEKPKEKQYRRDPKDPNAVLGTDKNKNNYG